MIMHIILQKLKQLFMPHTIIPHKKLWCVFQPHTYTRTKALLPEFAKALSSGRSCGSWRIFMQQEKPILLEFLPRICRSSIQELGTPCEYFPTFDEIENYLLSNCQEGDLLITMGAGDVVNIGEHLLHFSRITSFITTVVRQLFASLPDIDISNLHRTIRKIIFQNCPVFYNRPTYSTYSNRRY